MNFGLENTADSRYISVAIPAVQSGAKLTLHSLCKSTKSVYAYNIFVVMFFQNGARFTERLRQRIEVDNRHSEYYKYLINASPLSANFI